MIVTRQSANHIKYGSIVNFIFIAVKLEKRVIYYQKQRFIVYMHLAYLNQIMRIKLSFLHFLILFTLRVTSYVVTPTVCQSGEIGIGLIISYAGNQKTTNGAIYSSSCDLLDRSSESTWYQGGWGSGTAVNSGIGADGYSGPSGAMINDRVYEACYSLSQTANCILTDQSHKHKIPDHTIVPYCCASTAADDEPSMKDQNEFDEG